MKNLILIAPPAAGKGTISDHLVDNYGFIHISTGDLLRKEVEKQSQLGKEIDELISKGIFVNDEIMARLIKENLEPLTKPFILDGYPRNLAQAQTLDQIFHEIENNDYQVIYLDIDQDIALQRVLSRLVCPNCGKSYSSLFEETKPKQSGICDECKSPLIKRKDDTKEVFASRLETFMQVTKPVLAYYENKDNLQKIDAKKQIAEVLKEVESILSR